MIKNFRNIIGASSAVVVATILTTSGLSFAATKSATLTPTHNQITTINSALQPGQTSHGQLTVPGHPHTIWGYTGYRWTDKQVRQGILNHTLKTPTTLASNLELPPNLLTSNNCQPVVLSYRFWHAVTGPKNLVWYEVSDYVTWQFSPYANSQTIIDGATPAESANWPYTTNGSATVTVYQAGNSGYANAVGHFNQLSNPWTGPARSGYAYLNATFNESTVNLGWIDGFNPSHDTSWQWALYGPWPC